MPHMAVFFRKRLLGADPSPYNSWGNGSAMRVSLVAFAFDTEADILGHAKQSAVVTHIRPEGVQRAQATALTVFLARSGAGKETIRLEIEGRFHYDVYHSLDSIRPTYSFEVSCQGTVPEASVCFLDGDCFEDTNRNAVSLGGDSDTLACIAGGIAEAFYCDVPWHVSQAIVERMPRDLWEVTEEFCNCVGL
jgi:ADP-ribosylglycohydrolase